MKDDSKKAMPVRFVLVLSLLPLLFGCGRGGDDTKKSEDPAAGPPMVASPLSGGMEPATFEGDLPCADCAGIHYTLNLFPDETYFLSAVYTGKGDDARVDDIGRWSRHGGSERLVLRSGQDTTMVLAVKTDAILRTLDAHGREIESTLNHDLVRTESFKSIEPHGTLTGMYSYMADAGMFEECRTGLRLPVAQEGDNAALEEAYVKARSAPGDPLLTTVEGHIAPREGMDGAVRLALIVDRFAAVRPGEVCGLPFVNEELRNTHWRLTHLGDRTVLATGEKRAPWLRLTLDGTKMTGFTGCNPLSGTYTLDGSKLRFEDIAMTRMACPDGEGYEPDFPRALEATSSWKIIGSHLELYDDLGSVLARLESDLSG